MFVSSMGNDYYHYRHMNINKKYSSSANLRLALFEEREIV